MNVLIKNGIFNAIKIISNLKDRKIYVTRTKNTAKRSGFITLLQQLSKNKNREINADQERLNSKKNR